jgi:hypothetical protein
LANSFSGTQNYLQCGRIPGWRGEKLLGTRTDSKGFRKNSGLGEKKIRETSGFIREKYS